MQDVSRGNKSYSPRLKAAVCSKPFSEVAEILWYCPGVDADNKMVLQSRLAALLEQDHIYLENTCFHFSICTSKIP